MRSNLSHSPDSTQLNYLGPFTINSSLKETSPNSLSSCRASSQTVLDRHNKKNKPISISEDPHPPLSVQSLSRMKHQTRSKLVLNKKNLKRKCLQNRPIYRTRLNLVIPAPNSKTPQKLAKNEILKAERPKININQINKDPVKPEPKIKKKLEKAKFQTEKNMKKSIKLETQNTKIKIEKTEKIRKKKSSPKNPLTKAKLRKFDRDLKELENQRPCRRKNKKSPGCSSKNNLGLHRYLEVAGEIKVKHRSTSMQMEKDLAKRKEITKNKQKNLDKKKEKMVKNAENLVRKLSGLDFIETLKAEKKKKKKNDFEPEPKKKNKKNYQKIKEKQKNLEFNEKKHVSPFQVAGSGDRNKFLIDQVSAAIKIQYWVRKYLKKLKNLDAEVLYNFELNSSGSQSIYEKIEDSLVPEVLSDYNSKQLSFSESQVIDEQIVDCLVPEVLSNFESDIFKTPGYKVLYEQIKNLEEIKHKPSTSLENLDNEDQNFFETLKDIFEQNSQSFKSSFSSYKPETSFQDSVASKINPNFAENKLEKNQFFYSENKSEDISIEDPFQFPLISSANPEGGFNFTLVNREKTIVNSQKIQEISEELLANILIEIIGQEEQSIKSRFVDKDHYSYIGKIMQSTPEKLLKNELMKPIRKNPLDILAKLQLGNLNFYDHTPPIIPIYVFENVNKIRQEAVIEKPVKLARTAHDRVIFDYCNEALQGLRPYGTKGEPVPWACVDRELNKEEISVEEVLERLSRELEIMCEGPKIEQGVSKGKSEYNIEKMIKQDVIKSEEIWVEYGREETQSSVELGDIVLEWLIYEIVSCLTAST